jgi:hypothetical protein
MDTSVAFTWLSAVKTPWDSIGAGLLLALLLALGDRRRVEKACKIMPTLAIGLRQPAT